LLISQFAPGTPSQRGNFPMRNRTMALISDATIIVEARDDSGSLHQGWEALRLGRPLILMKALLTGGLQWADEMVRYGAVALELQDLDWIYEILPERSGDEPSRLAV